MRQQMWLITALLILFLAKGTGLYAMVHCPSTFQSTENSMADHNQVHGSASVQHEHTQINTASAAASDMNNSSDFAQACQACDDCCTIHCVAIPSTVAVSATETHDKVVQYSYFHSSAVVPTKERPPKSV